MTIRKARSSKRKSAAPDLRLRVTQHSAPPWQETESNGVPRECSSVIACLAQKHSFPTEFPLEIRLNCAWLIYEADQPQRTGKVVAAWLDTLIEQTAALVDTLKVGGSHAVDLSKERNVINESLEGVGAQRLKLGEIDVNKLIECLHDLRVNAEVAKRNATPPSAGRRGDVALRKFLASALSIYRAAFGNEAKLYTKRTDTSAHCANTYAGPLVNFFADLLKLLKVEKSNQALGKMIERMLSNQKTPTK